MAGVEYIKGGLRYFSSSEKVNGINFNSLIDFVDGYFGVYSKNPVYGEEGYEYGSYIIREDAPLKRKIYKMLIALFEVNVFIDGKWEIILEYVSGSRDDYYFMINKKYISAMKESH
jgi:hypothetical protein